MERILEEQAKEVAMGRTGLAQDAAFHAAIASSAHNRAITRIVNALMDLLSQSREESLHTPGRPSRSHQDHKTILEAIQRRDGPGAQRAMLNHLIAVERLVLGHQADEGTAAPGRRSPSERRQHRGAGERKLRLDRTDAAGLGFGAS
jgi:DNA-binding FadR family transcriptional regulator